MKLDIIMHCTNVYTNKIHFVRYGPLLTKHREIFADDIFMEQLEHDMIDLAKRDHGNKIKVLGWGYEIEDNSSNFGQNNLSFSLLREKLIESYSTARLDSNEH